jgi:AraC-like DNA-binding protein
MKQHARAEYSRAFDPAGEGDELTTLARLLSGFTDLVCELGGNPDLLLEDVGIPAGTLGDLSGRIPVCALGELLEHSAAALGCPDFGMRLAERQASETVMQPLDRLFRAAPTIGDVLACCVRHIGAFNSGLIMELDEPSASGLRLLDFKLVAGLSLFPQLMEQLLLLTHNSVIWLSAGFARSRTVWLSHLNIAPPVAYARRFNTVVKFGQENDGIFFAEADLLVRVAECNTERFALEAKAVAERFPTRQDITTKVRQTVFKLLTQSDSCTRQNVARLLGYQERTLNRRLSKGGTSFETIRDEVRRSLAYRYLARADLPLTEIAGRLGYSELAVLSRCCRRWFGSSPRQLRQYLLTEKAPCGTPTRPEPWTRLVA